MMQTWLNVKKFLLKFKFLIIFVILTLAILLLAQSKNIKLDSLKKILKSAEDKHEKEIEIIEEEERKRDSKKRDIHDEYTKIVDAIDKKYKNEEKSINKRDKKRIKNIVELYYDEPGQIVEKIERKYGINYVSDNDK